MKRRSAKNKGSHGQKEIAKKIAKVTRVEYDPSDPDHCDISVRTMGLPGTDVILRGKALERYPYPVIEVKRRKKNLSVGSWIRQAIESARKAKTKAWKVMFRRDRETWYVVERLDQNLEVHGKMLEYKRKYEEMREMYEEEWDITTGQK